MYAKSNESREQEEGRQVRGAGEKKAYSRIEG